MLNDILERLKKALMELQVHIQNRMADTQLDVTKIYEDRWDEPKYARHNARVIMDRNNLRWAEKDLLCAVISGESSFLINAKNENKNSAGKILSTDWGICQINDHYHIGPGKSFKSVQEVLENPEKSIQFLIDCYRQGHLDWWIAYKSGAYKRFL